MFLWCAYMHAMHALFVMQRTHHSTLHTASRTRCRCHTRMHQQAQLGIRMGIVLFAALDDADGPDSDSERRDPSKSHLQNHPVPLPVPPSLPRPHSCQARALGRKARRDRVQGNHSHRCAVSTPVVEFVSAFSGAVGCQSAVFCSEGAARRARS